MPNIPAWLPVVLLTCVLSAAGVWTVMVAGRSLWRRRTFRYHRLIGVPARSFLAPYEPDLETEARVVREQAVMREALRIVREEGARISEK